jgi:hypothetical protein
MELALESERRRRAAVLRQLEHVDLSRQWANTEIFFKRQISTARMLSFNAQTAARFNGHFTKCQVEEENQCRIMVKYVHV